MAKSIIILSVSLLLIIAVLIMLKYSGEASESDEASRSGYPNPAGDPYIPASPKPKEAKEKHPPKPKEPKPKEPVKKEPKLEPLPVVDLPKKVDLPCAGFVATRETSLAEIIDRYYGDYKSDKTRVIDNKSLRKELLAVLATYNGMSDSSVPVKIRETLKLPEIYVVVSGDTLDGIARRFYGKSTAVDRIYDVNPKLHTRGKGYLRIGWLLILP